MAGDVRRINFIVAAILTLLLALYANAVFFVIVPWLSYSVPSVLNLAGLSYTTFCSIYLYLMCVLVDPGRVPDGWKPDEESDASIVQVKKTTGKHRFCQKCQIYKPPRCHHCKVCKRCVLRMDHHCPWMNNCIGHRNHRAFISSLIFLLLMLLHNVCLLTAHQFHLISVTQSRSATDVQVPSVHSAFTSFQVMVIVGSGLAWLMLLSLLLWHLSLAASNKTTIEYYEGVNARLIASKNGTFWRHPYDLGMANNLIALFGSSFWKWVLPFSHLEGDGIHHRTVIESHNE